MRSLRQVFGSSAGNRIISLVSGFVVKDVTAVKVQDSRCWGLSIVAGVMCLGLDIGWGVNLHG